MPLWVFYALSLESYLGLGPASLPHFDWIQNLSINKWVNGVGLIAVLIAIAGVFFHLSPVCFWLFAAATLVAMSSVRQLLRQRCGLVVWNWSRFD